MSQTGTQPTTTAIFTLAQESRTKRRRPRRTGGIPARGALPLLVLLALWQVSGGKPPIFPVPSDWFKALWGLFTSGQLLPALGATAYSTVISLVVALVLGTILGYLIGRFRVLDRLLAPLLEFFRFTPASAILPIVVLMIGYHESAKTVVVIIGSIWPILLQTYQSSRTLSDEADDLATSLRMTLFQRFRKVHFPMLVPSILLGLRVATPVVLIMVILFEVITSVKGIGALIGHAQQTYDFASVYGLIVLVAVLSFVINVIVSALSKASVRHRGPQR